MIFQKKKASKQKYNWSEVQFKKLQSFQNSCLFSHDMKKDHPLTTIPLP